MSTSRSRGLTLGTAAKEVKSRNVRVWDEM